MIDELLKSQFWPVFVIPAKAGIQLFKHVMDSRRSLPSKVLVGGGNDRLGDFLRGRQICPLLLFEEEKSLDCEYPDDYFFLFSILRFRISPKDPSDAGALSTYSR